MLATAHLFAGGGGDTEGALAAGYKPLWAIESDKYAAAVYRKRFPDVQLIKADITTLADDFIRDLPAPKLLIAGSPCQDFSVAGDRAGLTGVRSSCFFEFIRFLRLLQPQSFIFENVSGLLSSNGGSDFAAILQSFTEVGYVGTWQVRNGKRWVPQNRERIFCVGYHREYSIAKDRTG